MSEESANASRSALGWADRLLPGLLVGSIAVGVAVGVVSPSIGAALSRGVPLGVFALISVVMFGVGTTGLTAAITERRFIAIAVALNFVVNPLLAWVLGALFLPDSADLRVGLLLFLVTPCIGWFLVFTDLAGGDTALAVGLLGVNLVLQVALLPIYLAVFVGDSAGPPTAEIVKSVVIFLVAPALLAATARRYWNARRGGTDRPPPDLTIVKVLLLVGVIVSMFASQATVVVEHPMVFIRLVVPMVLFFAVAFVIALAVGYRASMPPSQVALLVFTTTSRNSEASLAIAATAFASPLVGLAVVLGPVVELPLLVVMVRLLNHRRRRSERRRPGSGGLPVERTETRIHPG